MKFEYLIKTLETCLLYVSEEKKKDLKKKIKEFKKSIVIK